MPGTHTPEQLRVHRRKHTLLRRLAYQIVRDEFPDIWQELRKQVGLGATGRPMKKGKKRQR